MTKEASSVSIVCVTFVMAAVLVFSFRGSRFSYSPAELFSSSTFFGGRGSTNSPSTSSVKLRSHDDRTTASSMVQLQSKFGGEGGSSPTSTSQSSNKNNAPQLRVESPGEEKSFRTITENKTENGGKREETSRDEDGSALEKGLARARAAIRQAAARGSSEEWKRTVNDPDFPTDDSAGLCIYRNPAAFYRSYIEMERRFKVYVYTDGDPPMVHSGPCKDIYTTEGRFIHEMEKGGGQFRTLNPVKSHVYFMPFSVSNMVKYIYHPLSFNHTPLTNFVFDYVTLISRKYPYWNISHGADHFMLACHDWGPHASRGHKLLYNNSIRVLCNANSTEGFNPQKDVTLPEINLKTGNIHPKLLLISTNHTNHNRPNLAFFAGGNHGPIRPLLLSHWKDKEDDPDMLVYEYLPQGKSKQNHYYNYMLNSKFCLCPSGYEVASPRIVEAIYAECVPVILSVNYVLPFSDVLDWDKFSVIVDVNQIRKLKDILVGIDDERYTRLVDGVRAVRKHFVLNKPVKRFDLFHMILHSVWLRRLNLRFSS